MRMKTFRSACRPAAINPVPARLPQVATVHLILRKGNRVLLGRRQNTGELDGMFQFPAGHVDDETALAAVIREAKEEAGIELDPQDVRFVHVLHRRTNNRRTEFFFEATRWRGKIENREPLKCEGWDWYALTSLPPQIIEFLPYVLQQVARGETYSSYGWPEHLAEQHDQAA